VREEPGVNGALQSTGSMAVGTLASRATGFVRTVVIAGAIGRTVGDAYNVANTVPNIVYELLLGGVLTSVVVPLLVAGAHKESDGGERHAQSLLTVVVALLGAASVVAVLIAPQVIHVYMASSPVSGDRAHLATIFARFFLPQIFFYGVGAMLGAILNVRGSFSPPMWAPVLNNLVVIATGLLFIGVTSVGHVDAGVLTTGQTLLLAIGTTLGVVLQTVALIPALKAVGFRLRLRWDLRGVGLRAATRLAGWVFVYVLANQVGYLLITRLATGIDQPGAYSVYSYAFILFLLPHSVVAVSVMTALLPQMSTNAVEGRLGDVASDLAMGIKLAAVVMIPAAFAAIVLGPLISVVIFAHRTLPASTGRLIGMTLAAYAVSLLPFSAFQSQLRAFYALRDTRTPALVNIVLAAINVGAGWLLLLLLPTHLQVVGLAVAFSLSYFVGFAWFTILLRRRLGTPPGEHVVRTVLRLSVAAALAAAVAYAVAHAALRALPEGFGGSLLALIAGVAVGTPLYIAFIRRMRIPEVHSIAELVRGTMAGRMTRSR
jgi:putative peptidoglycan lipid II flippase